MVASPRGKSTRLKEAWNKVVQVIPALNGNKTKGMAGRIGVFGGCSMHTGAPFYAASAALKAGADIVYIFCEEAAAGPIKSYSPEIIVVPVIPSRPLGAEPADETDVSSEAMIIKERVAPYIRDKLDAMVIGSGLEDSPVTYEAASLIIKQARAAGIPLVIDGNAINVCANQTDIVSGYTKAVLTPNATEFAALCAGSQVPDASDLQALCWSLNNVTVLQKGKSDRASDGTVIITCDEPGSYRRCGGQGDIAAGILAVFMVWSHRVHAENEAEFGAFGPNLIASVAASTITRRCANMAFSECGRSMTASDVFARISYATNEFFPTSGAGLLSPSPLKSPM